MLTQQHVMLISSSGINFYANEQQWTRNGKLINEEIAIGQLRKLLGDTEGWVSEEEYRRASLSVKLSSTADEQLDLINNSVYLQHFYWKASGGSLAVFYSPNHTKELVPLALSADESSKPFLNAIREVPEWLQAFLSDYQQHKLLNKKLTVEGFASLLFKTLVITPTQQLVEEPNSLSWDTNSYSFKHFDSTSVIEGPTAAWDEFLDRLSNRDVFLAFVWSIFEEQNQGRQVLWLKGPGNDGKSRVISAISRYLGDRAVAALSQGTVSSQFFSSFVYGKRLTVFGDCMNTRLISTNAIHTLVGGDYASIEAKGKQAFAGRIYSKVIVGSNYSPEIDDTANQVSRLLYVRVAPLRSSSRLPSGDDSSFEDRLVQEMPHLLFLARRAYEIRCLNHGRISLSDTETEEMLLRTKSDMQEFIEQFCSDNFIFDSAASTDCQTLNAFFNYMAQSSGLRLNAQLDLNLLNRYIEEKLSLNKMKRLNSKGIVLRCWDGIRMSSKFEQFCNEKVMT